MAEALKNVSGADLCISITGYAGPEADPGHDAGEAFIGYVYKNHKAAVRVLTNRNDRRWNRNYFILRMMRAVYMLLSDRADEIE